jgi:hypothetical protein
MLAQLATPDNIPPNTLPHMFEQMLPTTAEMRAGVTTAHKVLAHYSDSEIGHAQEQYRGAPEQEQIVTVEDDSAGLSPETQQQAGPAELSTAAVTELPDGLQGRHSLGLRMRMRGAFVIHAARQTRAVYGRNELPNLADEVDRTVNRLTLSGRLKLATYCGLGAAALVTGLGFFGNAVSGSIMASPGPEKPAVHTAYIPSPSVSAEEPKGPGQAKGASGEIIGIIAGSSLVLAEMTTLALSDNDRTKRRRACKAAEQIVAVAG